MAHRTQYTKDIILPQRYQQRRLQLQRQITTVKQKQKQIIQENKQKIFMYEKRLQFGKKKIFAFDKKVNQMTLEDQINVWNREIEGLKEEIMKQEERNKLKKQKEQEEKNIQSDELFGLQLRKSVSGYKKYRKSYNYQDDNLLINQIQDPQQQIMQQTHQIIRLKKSLQQVRSKYNQNFTQYKLRQQYAKLKKQNQSLVNQIRELQKSKQIINQTTNSYNNPINYDQLETITAKKQYEIALKERNMLREYFLGVKEESQHKKDADHTRRQEYERQKIVRLKEEIQRVTNQNSILQNQISFKDKEIEKKMEYGKRLRRMTGMN